MMMMMVAVEEEEVKSTVLYCTVSNYRIRVSLQTDKATTTNSIADAGPQIRRHHKHRWQLECETQREFGPVQYSMTVIM